MSFFIFSRKLMVNYLIFFFIVSMGASAHSMSIDLIKSTYNNVNPDCRHLSLAHGAVWYEAGILKSYMLFGDEKSLIKNCIKKLFILHDDGSLQPCVDIKQESIGTIIGILETYRKSKYFNNKEAWLYAQLEQYSEINSLLAQYANEITLPPSPHPKQ